MIGLTGGTASGKTSIGKRLQKLGAAIIDCDALGKENFDFGCVAGHSFTNKLSSLMHDHALSLAFS